jgi:hypothetical protein
VGVGFRSLDRRGWGKERIGESCEDQQWIATTKNVGLCREGHDPEWEASLPPIHAIVVSSETQRFLICYFHHQPWEISLLNIGSDAELHPPL